MTLIAEIVIMKSN